MAFLKINNETKFVSLKEITSLTLVKEGKEVVNQPYTYSTEELLEYAKRPDVGMISFDVFSRFDDFEEIIQIYYEYVKSKVSNGGTHSMKNWGSLIAFLHADSIDEYYRVSDRIYSTKQAAYWEAMNNA